MFLDRAVLALGSGAARGAGRGSTVEVEEDRSVFLEDGGHIE